MATYAEACAKAEGIKEPNRMMSVPGELLKMHAHVRIAFRVLCQLIGRCWCHHYSIKPVLVEPTYMSPWSRSPRLDF